MSVTSSQQADDHPGTRIIEAPSPPREAIEPESEGPLEIEGAKPTPSTAGTDEKPDSFQRLRELTINVLVPTFIDLVQKYAGSGIFMQMDASDFLEGGREIRFDFAIGEHRAKLQGTVTAESIAFHETRHRPDVKGNVVSGPMLRLRGLDEKTFRDFVCERLATLIRSSLRRH